MNVATRTVLAALVVNVAILPLLTGHALLEETAAGHAGASSGLLAHPDLLLVLLLTMAACVPALRMLWTVRRSLAASRRLPVLDAGGVRREFRGIEYVRLPGHGVTFVTAGFRNPTIYVSERAESMLSRDALHAALLHERGHVRAGDARWLALVTALERALVLLPWSGRTFRRLRLLVERRADEYAVAHGAAPAALFDAIVMASGQRATGSPALAEVGTLQRLRWLAEPEGGAVAETRNATLLLVSLMTPPLSAHLVLWAGLLCALCSTHLR